MKFLYSKSHPLRTLLFLMFSFFLISLNAQAKSSKRIEVGIGPLLLTPDSENLSFLLNIEPKIQVLENTFFGLRLGAAWNSSIFENNNLLEFAINTDSDNVLASLVPVVDYNLKHIHLGEKKYQPYLGLGVGYYLLSEIDVLQIGTASTSEEKFEISVKKRIGLLLRGGFESRALRFGLEYNLMPQADIETPGNQFVGTVKNSFLGLSIGLLIGSRKI